jgi:hypothetical protein
MHGTGLRYRIVERELQAQRVEISLIREMVPRHRFLHHRSELVDVIARKTFLAWDVVGQTTLRGRFEHAIDYAQRGEFGCYILAEARPGGVVRMRLMERRLTDEGLSADILEEREFDATAPDSLLAASEYRGFLQFRAAESEERRARERNEALEAGATAVADVVRREQAAAELVRILVAFEDADTRETGPPQPDFSA